MFKAMPTLETGWCHPNCNCPIWILYEKCEYFKIGMNRNIHIHKLLVAWMWMPLSFWLAIVSQESSCCISKKHATKKINANFVRWFAQNFGGIIFTLTYTYVWELMTWMIVMVVWHCCLRWNNVSFNM